jgi:hypothetical protein
MTMCLASAADALVPRMARTCTDEQLIDSAVAAKLILLVPIGRIAAAQAEAKRLFDAAEALSLNTAIELACEAAVPQRTVLLTTIHAATEAVTGYALPASA